MDAWDAKAQEKIDKKDDAAKKGKSKGKGGKGSGKTVQLSRQEKDWWATRPKSERMLARPQGCCKCRFNPGCCPSSVS